MSEYKRLTKKDGFTKNLDLTQELGYSHIYNRLAELENKIKDWKLVELPCKVGDTVYYINDYGMGRYKIIPFNVRGFKIGSDYRLSVLFGSDWFAFAEDIFTTKEAAQARIEELQEEKK